MAMVEGLEGILREHPFFHGLPDPLYSLISGCARNALFEPGEHIFREGGEAGHFYLLREGQVALQLGRCQFGPLFLCKDGPVVRYDRVRSALSVPEV